MPSGYATPITRRQFLAAVAVTGTSCARLHISSGVTMRERPNIILCMTDDQGWGDVGYHGHPVLQTPNLDSMASSGLRMDRFYAGAPVCSPTRGSCITGRHPYRYGIHYANDGHLPPEEVTLAEVLKEQGYVTGHFGKWHLGTLTRTVADSNRGGPDGAAHYSPPWENGFDRCFSTEAKVPTWNPMLHPETGEPYGTRYWDERGEAAVDNLEGADSRVIMDRVIPFIQSAATSATPFFAVIWFHSPHLPVVAGPSYLAMYNGVPDRAQHYFGCITAMDEQLGRLRRTLRDLSISDNTMLWFCSDNGPEGQAGVAPGSAGPFRGRKRDLYEGGIRVPGLLEWPARIREPRTVTVPCSTLDYFPTVLDALQIESVAHPEPIDGVSLVPLFEGAMTERPQPIGFESRSQIALVGNRYKLISVDSGKTYALFDLRADPTETDDVAAEHPRVVAEMKRTLDGWRAACAASEAGKDYDGTS